MTYEPSPFDNSALGLFFGNGDKEGNSDMPSRGGLILATMNTGKESPEDALDVARKAHATAMQETGDRAGGRIKQRLRRAGFRIVEAPFKSGAPSTPLAIQKPLKLIQPQAYMTSHAQYGGPGAGPSHIKTKWIVGGVCDFNGVHIKAFSTHFVASSYTHIREQIALQEANNIARELMNSNMPTFVMGDFNAIPHDNVLAPLYRHGWTNSFEHEGVIPTHRNRAIDYVWWKKSDRIECVGQRSIGTSGDHKALLVTFRIH